MWIVRLALRRPYTFVVMAMLIAILGVVTIVRMPTDIFPEIQIPVISVIWNYTGMSPDEMEQRIVGNFERVVVSTVSGIEHIESQSLNGVAVVKIFLQPGADVDGAISQTTSSAEAALKSMPPGIFPPLVLRYTRVECADSASLARQRQAERAAIVRPGDQHASAGNGDRARCADSVSLRRQSAADDGRYRPAKSWWRSISPRPTCRRPSTLKT